MEFNETSIAFGTLGLAVGVGAHLWTKKIELEQRCEFLTELKSELSDAFLAAGRVLGSDDTPQAIRKALLHLLASHADPTLGGKIAKAFLEHVEGRRDRMPADGTDAISVAMAALGRSNPSLARETHHTLASLSFGLVFLHLADSIRIEKVQDEAARDPVSLWSRIARMFGTNGDKGPHGGPSLAHA